ncbi:AI-2E family transporter [Opitutus terrae]|uniref:Permease n=1 Tax=Opitutus terrae (strain DSM 11246 / JCM 15787 / PB90-1) TaxID=452637 RepID=B1ZZ97_OPITP|nr:AI-2E family transporter [Opitutus terrae]ACB77169.1 protein of unknown function UPF0118 [Opitutus terrae PB90-1]
MPSSPTTSRGTRTILIAIGLVALAAVLWLIADAIVVAFGGIVLASVLLSLSGPLSRKTHLGARWSLLIVVALMLVAVAALSWLFGNEIVTQFGELQRQLPEALHKVEQWLGQSPAGRMVVDSVRQVGGNTEALSQAGAFVGSVFGAAANLLLVLFLGVYFAADPQLYRDGALRLVPPRRRPQLRRALDDAGVALRKWLVAQAIAMLAVGVLTGVALGLIGVPLALSLGVLAGLLEFVPVIGPIVAAVPGLLLAFSHGPNTVLYAALVYVAVQQIESNVITPLVQRWAVKLPPVLGLLAIVAFGLLLGVPGVIFAMPLAVVVMVLVKDLYVEDTLEAKPHE